MNDKFILRITSTYVTLGDLYNWYINGEEPGQNQDKSIITEDGICELLGGGLLDNFGDEDDNPDFVAAEEFFKKNWNYEIQVTSENLGNVWQLSFWISNKEYIVDAFNYFGGDLD